MVVRISRIHIKDFRNFHDFDVSLGDHAVIVGENKVGKSNLLFAVQLVLDPSLPETARQLRMEDFWDGLQRPLTADHRIEIIVELTHFEDNEDQLAVLAEHLVQPSPMTARLTYVFQPKASDEGGPKKGSDYEYFVFGGDRPENLIGSEVRRRIPMSLLPALRDAESDLLNWRRSPLRPLLETAASLIDAEELQEVAEEVSGATNAVTDIQEIKKVAGNLAAKLIDMVGDTQAVDTALGFSPTGPERLIRSLRLFIDGGERAISDASLGSANLIYLALKSLELEHLVQSHERDHTFLAIEEPEAHLHPHLQRLVYRAFLRPRDETQEHDPAEDHLVASATTILLTTHSPHIVSVAPVPSFVVLRQHSQENATIGHSTASVDFTQSEISDLERYLNVTRGEILFARGVLLVEGQAELFVIPALATLCGTNLDKLGISVCSVSGTHFGPYVKLLGPSALNTPFAVITDHDPRPDGSSLGAKRVIRLLRELVDADQLLDKEEPELLEFAEEYGLFLNEYTFEVDLFRCGRHGSICKTLMELAPGPAARQRAKRWKAGPDSLDEEQFLKDIEAIGKGRFAQGLCAHLVNNKCPAYIRNAIRYVAERCK